jgi:hypothetical protein
MRAEDGLRFEVISLAFPAHNVRAVSLFGKKRDDQTLGSKDTNPALLKLPLTSEHGQQLLQLARRARS